MKEKFQILKVRLSIWLINLAEWISPSKLSKESVLEDAKKIYPYAIILWSDDDIWVNAFRVFVDRGLFNKKELARFKRKAELQRRSKAMKEKQILGNVKEELRRSVNG